MHTEDLAHPSWECVHFVTEPPQLDVLENEGIEVAELDGAAIPDKDALLEGISEAFRFPDYSGSNWDAVEECLRDLSSWLPAEGYVLLIRGAGALWSEVPEPTGTLLGIWLGCAESWAERKTSFHLVFVW